MVEIGIYLIGCIVAYILCKIDWKQDIGYYTKTHRLLNLTLSLLSWITALAVLVFIFVRYFKLKGDEEAKW